MGLRVKPEPQTAPPWPGGVFFFFFFELECAEKLAAGKWEIEKMEPLMSTFEKILVLNFSNVDKMAPISQFSIISRRPTSLHSALLLSSPELSDTNVDAA